MEENQVSRTAMLAAYLRAYHAMHDTPKIFDDFLANRMLTEEERAFLEQFMMRSLQSINPAIVASTPNQATALAWLMQGMAGVPIMLGRARYAEDSLEKAVGKGVQQYVILGAGMDTFAFRRLEMLKQLHLFEVDHPATQAFKRRRLAELGWEHPAHLHFIPMDFKKESLAEALTRSSYDSQALSFFSWLGVTYYLPREAVFATLRSIAEIAPAGSMITFDYMDTDAFVPEKAAPRVLADIKLLQKTDEPMITGFDPFTLAADLKPLGLRLHEDLSPWDIQIRYFMGRTDYYRACEHVHYACVVVE